VNIRPVASKEAKPVGKGGEYVSLLVYTRNIHYINISVIYKIFK